MNNAGYKFEINSFQISIRILFTWRTPQNEKADVSIDIPAFQYP